MKFLLILSCLCLCVSAQYYEPQSSLWEQLASKQKWESVEPLSKQLPIEQNVPLKQVPMESELLNIPSGMKFGLGEQLQAEPVRALLRPKMKWGISPMEQMKQMEQLELTPEQMMRLQNLKRAQQMKMLQAGLMSPSAPQLPLSLEFTRTFATPLKSGLFGLTEEQQTINQVQPSLTLKVKTGLMGEEQVPTTPSTLLSTWGVMPRVMPARPQFGWGRRGGFRRGGFRRGGYYRPFLPIVPPSPYVVPAPYEDPYAPAPYVVIDPYRRGAYERWDDPYFYGYTQ